MNKNLTRLTKTPKISERVVAWYIVDAKGQVLGRLSTVVAGLLMGKGKATVTPGQDSGDHVIVVNAKDVATTGKKEDKPYYRHTGYPGGLKTATLSSLRATYPDRIIKEAVKGMLPKNRLGAAMIKKLHISSGSDHDFSDKKLTEVKLG